MTTDRTPQQEAQDPRTSAARLGEIWRELYNIGRIPEVAEAMAVHPNTPPNLLAMLANVHSKAVLRNPALPLILQKDAKWAQSLQPDATLKLLRFENVPAPLLSAFAERPGPVGDAARRHVGLAGEAGPGWEAELREVLWEISEQRGMQAGLLVRLLTLDLMPSWLLEPLAAHDDARVRRAVARSPHTPAGLLTPLRRAGSTSDLGGLAPPDVSLPVPVLERLARGGGVWAKRLAALHPNTPSAVLEALADHQKTQPRYDKDETLCRYLVQNPNTPSALRAAMAVEFETDFRRASARDPNTPPIALTALSTNEVRDVRWMTARNPNTPVEALEVLAGDTDARVRQGVGRNSAAPPGLLARLAADPVRWVRLAAARHPQASPHVLERLAEDSDEEVRQSVARRASSAPSAPHPPKPFRSSPEVSVKQAPPLADPAERVQALNEAAQIGNMRGGLSVTLAALACPDTPLPFLLKGATDTRWTCRLAVARNPAAFLLALERPGTEADLHSLARDGNCLVRAAAQEALRKAGIEPWG